MSWRVSSERRPPLELSGILFHHCSLLHGGCSWNRELVGKSFPDCIVKVSGCLHGGSVLISKYARRLQKRNQIHLYRMQWSNFCPVLRHRLEQVLLLSSSELSIH